MKGDDVIMKVLSGLRVVCLGHLEFILKGRQVITRKKGIQFLTSVDRDS
jgi:hypothetical protein